MSILTDRKKEERRQAIRTRHYMLEKDPWNHDSHKVNHFLL